MRYKIHVKTLQNDLLHFSVDDYNVEDGFIVFLDLRTSKEKRFAVSNCEVEVLE